MRLHTIQDGERAREVSAMCLGTMYFGTTIDVETSYAILDAYLEAGGTFLDTANCYSFWAPGGVGGESEEVLGQWLVDRGVRDRMTIATKVGAGPARPDEPYDAHNREGLGPFTIARELEGSLRRLGVEHVDLLYAHAEDRRTPLAATLGAFDETVSRGQVGMIAASNHTAWRLAVARETSAHLGCAKYAAAQQRHTHLDPRPLRGILEDEIQLPITDDLIDYARAEGDLTLLGFSPLISGAYTREDRPIPDAYDHRGTPHRLEVLTDVAAELGVTPNQLVLARMLHGEPPILPIIGVSSVAQLEESLGALDIELDDTVIKRLDAA